MAVAYIMQRFAIQVISQIGYYVSQLLPAFPLFTGIVSIRSFTISLFPDDRVAIF